jgi:hypothetical protein
VEQPFPFIIAFKKDVNSAKKHTGDLGKRLITKNVKPVALCLRQEITKPLSVPLVQRPGNVGPAGINLKRLHIRTLIFVQKDAEMFIRQSFILVAIIYLH